MKPLKLTMQAFGSYGQKTTIDFTKPDQNLFLVTGDTGAGKTTIFDGIVFALYGEASSASNKKEGVVLQSQYADLSLEPYVELEFTEGPKEDVYTVRRIPRHLKTITRGAAKGVGTREITGSVTLIMPDGTEYPQKESNAKIQEITGLTKSQFMQVAMIAQGEFMELLRAKSDDKKKIFRKLFNTEMYENIASELWNRKREREKDIAVIKTQCQGEAARVKILSHTWEESEAYTDQQEIYASDARLLGMKNQIADGEITVIGEFLEELCLFCGYLKKELETSEEKYEKTAELRDKKREGLARAEQVQKLYEQLQEAEKELSECAEQAENMRQKENLALHIEAAFEIKTAFDQFYEKLYEAEKTEKSLREQEQRIPELAEKVRENTEKEQTAQKLSDQAQAEFSRVVEKAEKALKLFEQIENARKKVTDREKEFNKLQKQELNAKKALEELEGREKELRKQREALADAGEKLALCQTKMLELQGMGEDIRGLSGIYKDIKRYGETADNLRQKYAISRKKYEKKQQEYEEFRRAFLDAQAGFLASQLVPGKPCPVCGSLEHPSPCISSEKYKNLSQEAIDALGKEAELLRAEQERLAAEIKSNEDLKAARDRDFKESFLKLQQRMRKNIPELPEEFSPGQAQEFMKQWMQQVRKEGTEYQGQVLKLQELQKNLKETEEQKPLLKSGLDTCSEDLKRVQAALEGAKAELASYSSSTDFESREAAKAAENTAKIRRDQLVEALEKTRKETEISKAKQTDAKTLIRKYTEELPGRKKEAECQKKVYESLLKEKDLTEKLWKQLTDTYSKASPEEFRKEINAFHTRQAEAHSRAESMKTAIGEKERPVLESIRSEVEAAEKNLKAAEEVRDSLRSVYQDNQEVYHTLAPRLAMRQKLVKEHAKLDNLYRLVSGNVSGSRMDLETYVQRYYLEKILDAANKRFQEMSAGQFELRMCNLEKAGEGKNRGLDLMVYSTVTGKEREIRTLSGGESFMAALSLALGMADQIQESSAAINLEIMFIDEGFGSLDEHSRNQAVKVLLEMAEGSKLIGIISHVTELKQEIEDQLLVTRDETGSHVRWQIS